MPTRYTPPACTWPALPSACSTVFQSGSVARETPGIAAATTTSNTIARFNRCDFMICVSFVHFAYHAYRRSLVELLQHGLPVGTLEQHALGDGMGILHRRHDADRAVPRVGFHGVGCRGRERPLRFRHRLALFLGVLQVIPLGDGFRLRHLARLVIDDHLRELVTLHGIDR